MHLNTRSGRLAAAALATAALLWPFAQAGAAGKAPPDTTKMSRIELMAWRASQKAGAAAGDAAVEALPPLPAGVTRVTDSPGDEKGPRWTPDGEALVFAYSEKGASRVYRQNLADGTRDALTAEEDKVQMPALSPDGRHLAFTRTEPGAGQKIWVMRLEDGEMAKLTRQAGKERESHAEWSANGKRLYFEQSVVTSPNSRPMEIRRDGEMLEPLLEQRGFHTSPAVSGDGLRVAWVHRLGRQAEIVVTDTRIRGLTESYVAPGYFIGSADWLPGDASFVVSYLDLDEPLVGYNLGILDLATGELTELLDLGGTELEPRVSPDGRRVAFRSDREDGQDDLYIYELP